MKKHVRASQNKSECRRDRNTEAGGVQHGADLIAANAFILLLVKAEEGKLRIFPCCSVASLSFPLLLFSLRSMAPGWFHSSLHCHPEQINVTMRKARAALFLRRANSLLESLSDLLYPLSPPLSRTVRKDQAYPHLFRLSYGANYKLHGTQPLHTSVLINHI